MAGEITKKTKGKQKIEIKKIENNEERLVAFSKRKAGIHKKASELVTLTGAEVAFIVYSPAGNPFAFGHPSMEAVFNRFLNREGQPNDAINPQNEAEILMRIEELNKQHNELVEQIEREKKKEKELKQKMEGMERNGWWDIPIEQLNMQELLEIHYFIDNLRIKLINNLRQNSNSNAAAAGPSSAVVTPSSQLQPLSDQPPSHSFHPLFFNENDSVEFLPTNPNWQGSM